MPLAAPQPGHPCLSLSEARRELSCVTPASMLTGPIHSCPLSEQYAVYQVAGSRRRVRQSDHGALEVRSNQKS